MGAFGRMVSVVPAVVPAVLAIAHPVGACAVICDRVICRLPSVLLAL
jgi:hypothetical protein